MKQGRVTMFAIVLVLCIGAVAYLGVYIWRSLTDGTTTTALHTQTCEETLSVTGWFFRDETVLTGNADLTEVLAAEGERVSQGDVVARLYLSETGYQLQQELDAAQAELENLQYILSRTGEVSGTGELDNSIVEAFTALKGITSSGDFSSLSAQADELRTLVFRRDYTYSGSDSLTEQIDEAQARVDLLASQTGSAYTTVTATASGLFSAVVDGYEDVMTLDALEGLDPAGLAALAGRQKTVSDDALGVLITNNGWYYACSVPAEYAGLFAEDSSATLRFSDSSRDYTATVWQASEEVDGVVTLVFHSGNYAAQLTSLRCEDVDLILDSATGLRVAKRAIRVNDEGQTGIYRLSGSQAEWIPVDILWDDGDYYLVEQTVEGTLTAFETASLLRDGDTVIVRGANLYDGKVVEG